MKKTMSNGIRYYLMDVEVIKKYIQQFEPMDNIEEGEY